MFVFFLGLVGAGACVFNFLLARTQWARVGWVILGLYLLGMAVYNGVKL